MSTPVRSRSLSPSQIDPLLYRSHSPGIRPTPSTPHTTRPLDTTPLQPVPRYSDDADPIDQPTNVQRSTLPDETPNIAGSSEEHHPPEGQQQPRDGKPRRPRPTAANPIYGLVEEAFRGERPHCTYLFDHKPKRIDIFPVIFRSHALSEKIDDREKCQKYFLDTINNIVARVFHLIYYLKSLPNCN